jgi:hypothetical protein
MTPNTIVLTDESVFDADGERLLIDGLDLTRYQAHNVLLGYHDDKSFPIGGVVNIRREGSQLLGDIEFDEDERSQEYAEKFKNGRLGVSIGYLEKAYTNDEALRLEGQPKPTTTLAELFEVSLVSLPSNPKALKQKNFKTVQTPTPILMNLVKKALNLSESASEADVLDSVNKMTAKIIVLTEKSATLEASLVTAQKDLLTVKATALVDLAIQEKKIMAGEKDLYVKLATSNYEDVDQLLKVKKAFVPISQQMNTGGQAGNTEDRSSWSYMDWIKKDSVGLQTMKSLDPNRFAKLQESLSA